MLKICYITNVYFALLAVAALMAGQADGVFISPRHSQVEMKGDWYPEIQREGKKTRCHWMSGTAGESLTLKFEGTSVAVSTRTGARVTWKNVTHTNSLARLGRFAVRLDGRPLARSCASCHGAFKPDQVSKYGDRRWEWVDLTRPDASPALVAHLPKSAGGRGLSAKGKFSFSGRDDPLWKKMREQFRAGAAFAAQTPEPDEAGFVPRSRGRLEYETLLKSGTQPSAGKIIGRER